MKILVPTAGTAAAQNSAHYIVDIAARMNADVVALHIVRDGESEAEAAEGPRVFADAGREAGVKVIERVESGKIVPTIHMVADEVSAGLIIMGASNGTVVGRWTSSNVLDTSNIPVLVIPHVMEES